MTRIEVPAAEGRAFRVDAGAQFRITTPKGQQAADFFAFSVANLGEWLSPNHTWVWTRSVKPRQDDVILSVIMQSQPPFRKREDAALSCDQQ